MNCRSSIMNRNAVLRITETYLPRLTFSLSLKDYLLRFQTNCSANNRRFKVCYSCVLLATRSTNIGCLIVLRCHINSTWGCGVMHFLVNDQINNPYLQPILARVFILAYAATKLINCYQCVSSYCCPFIITFKARTRNFNNGWYIRRCWEGQAHYSLLGVFCCNSVT